MRIGFQNPQLSWLEPQLARFAVILGERGWVQGRRSSLISCPRGAEVGARTALRRRARSDGAELGGRTIWYVTLPMMRTIIAITALFLARSSTFANFRHRAQSADLRAAHGGPDAQCFADLGVQGSASRASDMPARRLGVALHVPDPGVAACSSCATSAARNEAEQLDPHGAARTAASKRTAARAAIWSYVLPRALRRLLPDAAALHADHVAEDQRGDLGGAIPWWVFAPTLDNYTRCSPRDYLDVLPQLGAGVARPWSITMLISIPAAFALSRMKFWGSTTLARACS
jgi:hypothetical protein